MHNPNCAAACRATPSSELRPSDFRCRRARPATKLKWPLAQESGLEPQSPGGASSVPLAVTVQSESDSDRDGPWSGLGVARGVAPGDDAVA